MIPPFRAAALSLPTLALRTLASPLSTPPVRLLLPLLLPLLQPLLLPLLLLLLPLELSTPTDACVNSSIACK